MKLEHLLLELFHDLDLEVVVAVADEVDLVGGAVVAGNAGWSPEK